MPIGAIFRVARASVRVVVWHFHFGTVDAVSSGGVHPIGCVDELMSGKRRHYGEALASAGTDAVLGPGGLLRTELKEGSQRSQGIQEAPEDGAMTFQEMIDISLGPDLVHANEVPVFPVCPLTVACIPECSLIYASDARSPVTLATDGRA